MDSFSSPELPEARATRVDRLRRTQDRVLELLYKQSDQSEDLYTRDASDALDLDYGEFMAHVYAELCQVHLLDLERSTAGSPRGWTFRLSAYGLLQAEKLKGADPQKVQLHRLARVVVLERLAALREKHGGRPVANVDRTLIAEGQPWWAIDAAFRVLRFQGHIDQQHGHYWLITRDGLEWLEAYHRHSALLEDFRRIEALSPAARGKALEQVLARGLELQGLRCRPDTGGEGEQIDLAVDAGGEHFVCESKWEAQRLQPRVVDQMAGRMLRRPPFYSGVIFSMSGFTDNAYVVASRVASHRVVHLIGERAIRAILTGEQRFIEVIAAQRRQLAEEGCLRRPEEDEG